MTGDLKERLQKHDWRHLTARIEQLEAQLAEEKARHALTIQQSDHFSAQLDTAADLAKDRNLQLAALQAQLAEANSALEEEAANAGRAWSAWESVKAQLAAAREALGDSQSLLVMIDHIGADSSMWIREDLRDLLTDQITSNRAALATAPATDGGDNEDHG